MPAYRLTPSARDGLRRVFDQLVTAFEVISESPGIGHRREDLTPDDRVRFWSVGPSLIAYRVGPGGGVEILFIERGERDWGQIIEKHESGEG